MQSLHQAVFRALTSALGESSVQPSVRVFQAYVNPSPPPPPEGQDAVYFSLAPGIIPPLTEESISSVGHPSLFRYADFRLNLVFYGPRAEELAWKVYHALFRDGWGSPRQILRQHGIYPVPRSGGPTLVWEEWKEQHRPRADLTVPLRIAANETDTSVETGCVESPPAIIAVPSSQVPGS